MRGPNSIARRLGGRSAVALATLLACVCAPVAEAAGPPVLAPSWASQVTSTSARLHATITPNGAATSYHFDYISAAAFEANVTAGKEGFSGALKSPAGNDPTVGSGSTPIPVSQPLSGLAPETRYRYRVVAKNAFGNQPGPPLSIRTQAFGGGPILLDGRGWELVSPVEKNGGQVDAPETIAGGGVFQAAAGGGAITYSSATSFGSSAQGAPQGSQYIATRTGSGWANEDISTPMLSGSYGAGPVGVPYQLFSQGLADGLLLNGRRCRGAEGDCPVANPPLPGSGAPTGYQNYYLRQSGTGTFDAIVDGGDIAHTAVGAAHFELTLAGASADLRHVAVSSCAALTANAIEVPDGDGCDAGATNLYLWSGDQLTLVNPDPGAVLAASTGAISADGNRVYFTQGGMLQLREGASVKQADAAAGGGGTFEAGSSDGAVAYFTREGHLWRYEATADSATDLTPAGDVVGVLGASPNGAYVYYLTGSGLFVRHGSTVTQIAPGAGAATPTSYPPATGTARVSGSGERLVFVSAATLTEFDNTDQGTGEADSEVYLYDAPSDQLTCISCNPGGARPIGPSSLPGSYANGGVEGSFDAYKPRVLSADGRRLFFDSADALVLGDTNGEPDAYEWEAQGTGSCSRSGGCLALLSSGKAASPSSFLDASADGAEAYFRTEQSLVPNDPGSIDLYVAKVGGGFPISPAPIPCEGDACQTIPADPPDPAVGSLVPGPGNPAVRYPKRPRKHHRAKRGKHRSKGAKSKRGKHGKKAGRARGSRR